MIPMESHDQTLAELTRALEHETGLVRQLSEALVSQRAGVAGGAPEAIHAGVEDIGRILFTIEEARRRRSELVDALTGNPDQPLERIEATFGAAVPAAFTHRRRALRAAAELAMREATINRSVLRHALEAGEAYLQALFSSPDAVESYGPSERRDDTAATGMILNRRA
jgi:hypothetical protein